MDDSIFKVVSGRMHKALATQLDKIARREEKHRSDIVKEAVMDYMARHEDKELPEPVRKHLDQSDRFEDVYAEDFFIKEENKKISVSYKERTFLNFMDKQLAQVWYMNKDYYCDKELKNVLRNHLDAFRVRAEWHGLEGRFEDRLSDPIQYGKDFLDRNRKAQSFEVDLT